MIISLVRSREAEASWELYHTTNPFVLQDDPSYIRIVPPILMIAITGLDCDHPQLIRGQIRD